MNCSRCKGCMVEDHLLDMEDSSGPMWLQVWRCMNCGHVFDSVLEHHRQLQRSKPTSVPSDDLAINSENDFVKAKVMTRLVA
ncbi:MAG: hypothetical protein K0S45_3619 [Nitrospira sp.]|jgi:hypothetical protein|nr:hypothetical protein [Nitrospira sp.]